MQYNGAMTVRIGILGGTFDPIHFGHLAIAEDARVTLGLERVLIIPAAQQPFKRDQRVTSGEQRMAMVELACAGNAALTPLAIELARAGVSYTATTLEELHEQSLGELFFILGADAVNDLPKWHRASVIPELAQIVAVERPGVVVEHAALLASLPMLRGRLTLLDGPHLNLSSTEIRRRAAGGRSLRYLTPDPVVEYINRERIYYESPDNHTARVECNT